MIRFNLPIHMVESYTLHPDDAMFDNERIWMATDDAMAKITEFGGICNGTSHLASGVFCTFREEENATMFKLTHL
jgi:hypothetical protein